MISWDFVSRNGSHPMETKKNHPLPNQSRFEVTWSSTQIRVVEKEIKKYSFLEGYTYESG
jgi:hypothetical protein